MLEDFDRLEIAVKQKRQQYLCQQPGKNRLQQVRNVKRKFLLFLLEYTFTEHWIAVQNLNFFHILQGQTLSVSACEPVRKATGKVIFRAIGEKKAVSRSIVKV